MKHLAYAPRIQGRRVPGCNLPLGFGRIHQFISRRPQIQGFFDLACGVKPEARPQNSRVSGLAGGRIPGQSARFKKFWFGPPAKFPGGPQKAGGVKPEAGPLGLLGGLGGWFVAQA
jgi:hypothetical protein